MHSFYLLLALAVFCISPYSRVQGSPGDEWFKDCQQAVVKVYGEDSQSLQEQCSDRSYAIMMEPNQAGISDANAVSAKIVASNRGEVGWEMLRLFFLGLGIAGLIGFIIGVLKEKKGYGKNIVESHQEK